MGVSIPTVDALARNRSAEDAVARLEARIAGELPPKENLTAGGPRPTPVPQPAKKKARVRARASKRANRSRKPTRRQAARRVAPR